MSKKTVVELDLVGYSDVSRTLEENVGVEVVAQFNDQIQDFVDIGLKAVGARRADVVLSTTGDGAIVAFDQATDSHKFAVAVQEATRKHNATRTTASSRRWFRIGAATGDLLLRPRAGGGKEMAGTVIANAVRLETAAKPGQLLVDAATFASLPAKFRGLYGPEEAVSGKRDERFAARRYTVIPNEAYEDARPTIQSILDMFDRLNPRDQLDRVMVLIGMPEQFRPPNTLELYRRQDKLLDWAARGGDGLMRSLATTLKDLIRKQQPFS